MTPNTKKIIARILLFAVAAFILLSGLQLMFVPQSALDKLRIVADNSETLSNIRALWGGAIAAIGISVIIAGVTLNINNARPAVLFAFMLVIARVTGIIIDGMFDGAILYLIVPIVVFGVLLTAHKLLDKVHEAEAAN